MRRLILSSLFIMPPVAVAAGWLLGWGWELMLLLPAPLLWLWATLVPRCEWWGPQMRSFRSRHREVLLTFDDGPCPRDTPAVLAMLAEAGAVGAFFLNGQRARQYPELVRAIARAGHAIGCHTMTDAPRAWWAFTSHRQQQEIEHCLAAIHAAEPECQVRWFRAPGGLRNHALHPLLLRHRLELMGWSASDGEWRMPDEDNTLMALKRDIDKGSVIQLHEGRSHADGSSRLLPVLQELLVWLKAQSYQAGV